MRAGDGATSLLPENYTGRVSRIEQAAAAWPTPDAAVSNDGEEPETFLARQERVKAKGINGNGIGIPLAMAAKLWPTPEARDHKGANQATLQDRGAKGAPLNEVAVLWRTPRSHEVGEYQYSQGNKEDPTPTLTGQAQNWQTPATDAFRSRGGDRNNEKGLSGQACSLPLPVTYQVGDELSKPRRSLNPLFVEWLMGWPPGWTLHAWTDFACSETELSRFKLRMRSALYAVGWPQAAPPAQLNLFG
jgi:hypothetical protein